MTANGSRRNRLAVAALLCGAWLWCPEQTLAAGTGADWRPIYDTVMLWVNFVILAALLIKFLRRPLAKFFNDQRDSVQGALEALESEKNRMAAEITSLEASMEDRKSKAADLKRRIVAQGEDERREAIEAARQEAQRRLAKARQQIEARQRDAWRTLRNEMIDAAVSKAMAIMPRHVTPEVEQALTEQFLKSISDSH